MGRRDKVTATTKSASVTFDNTEIMRVADKMSGGALKTFRVAAHAQMDPIVRDAGNLWPRRLKGSRDSAHSNIVRDVLHPSAMSVTAYNTTDYGYYIRYSVRTKRGIEAEAEDFAADLWGRIEWYTRRGNTAGARSRIANHFIEELSDGTLKKWNGGNGDISQKNLQKVRLYQLRRKHGEGAPNERLAGRSVWGTRVRTPVRKGTNAVIDASRTALDTLARG